MLGYLELGRAVVAQASADFLEKLEDKTQDRDALGSQYRIFLSGRLCTLLDLSERENKRKGSRWGGEAVKPYQKPNTLPAMPEVISFDSMVNDAEGITVGDTIPDQGKPVDDSVIDSVYMQQVSDCLREAMTCLTDKQAQVIHMIFFEDMTGKEVAAITGMTATRIAGLKRDALAKLRTGRHSKQIREYYDMIYTEALHGGGVSAFKRTNTSSTERVALQLLEGLPTE